MIYFRCICILFLLWDPVQVIAGGMFKPGQSFIDLPGVIVLPDSIPNGSTLWTSSTVNSRIEIVGAGHVNLAQAEIYSDIADGSSRNGDIYETSLSGIGVRWRATWRARNFGSGKTMSITTMYENNPGPAGWRYSDIYEQTIWVELVKTGPIQAGVLSVKSRPVTRFFCPSCNEWVVTMSGTTTVQTVPVCKIASTNIGVPMPTTNISRFTGQGSVSDAASFKIALNCSGGMDGATIRPFVTLTDASDRENRSNILSLSREADLAQGIGIQILKDDTVLSYGPASSDPGTVNQWQGGTIAQGVSVYEIPLTVRYVQTAPTMTGGTANGRAIFTMSYQ